MGRNGQEKIKFYIVPDSFSINNQPVMLPKEQYHLNTMGQRMAPAFSDHLMLNKAYGCSNCAAGAPGTAVCKNGGYPNPNWCSKCLCPSGWAGNLCDQRQPSTPDADCVGATLTVSLWSPAEWIVDMHKFDQRNPNIFTNFRHQPVGTCLNLQCTVRAQNRW